MRTGSVPSHSAQALRDPVQALEESRRLLDDLGVEAEVVDGVEVRQVLTPDDHLGHELVPELR